MSGIIISFIIAVLAGLGVGGGGLLVIYLTFFTTLSAGECQGLNLAFFLTAALSSLPFHLKHRQIQWRGVGILLLGGMLGAFAGAMLGTVLTSKLLRILFGCFLILAGCLSFREKH